MKSHCAWSSAGVTAPLILFALLMFGAVEEAAAVRMDQNSFERESQPSLEADIAQIKHIRSLFDNARFVGASVNSSICTCTMKSTASPASTQVTVSCSSSPLFDVNRRLKSCLCNGIVVSCPPEGQSQSQNIAFFASAVCDPFIASPPITTSNCQDSSDPTRRLCGGQMGLTNTTKVSVITNTATNKECWKEIRVEECVASESCDAAAVAAVNCVVSDWKLGTCSVTCGDGSRTDTRSITTPASGGGTACPTDLSRTVPCSGPACVPKIDCVVSDWALGACSVTCGDGSRIDTRKITTPASGGGTACPSDLSRTVPCSRLACVPKVDCAVSDWIGGTCSVTCGEGSRVDTRKVTTPASGGGAACPTDLSRTVTCSRPPCKVDCVVSSWTDNTCSFACGTRNVTDTRKILKPASNGGTPCPSDLKRTFQCVGPPCPS